MPASVSDYWQLCRRYISDALQRPGMHLTSLDQLEWQLHGHGVAFGQLDLLRTNEPSFNRAFGEWLEARYQCSTARGWADAVESEAAAMQVEPLVLFRESVNAFWTEWAAD